MLTIYPAVFSRDEDGYSVLFPDLNHLATCGETLDEAMAMAVDCLAGYLYTCQKDGETVPAPSALDQIDLSAIAREEYDVSDTGEMFVNLVAVDVQSYAKAHFEKSVKKTLTIPAWLNTFGEANHVNFSQLLQDSLLSLYRNSIK